MNRLRDFRTRSRLTQEELAEMLHTSQQTVARWETGKAEPSLSALRDLAIIFRTSVDELLGKEPIASMSSLVQRLSGEPSDAYWGHFGVLTPQARSARWFPITLEETKKLDVAFMNANAESPWITCRTLNNKLILVNSMNVKRLWLVDEADDPPDDWQPQWDANEILPTEIYAGLEDYRTNKEALRAGSSEQFFLTVQDLVEEHKLDDAAISKATECVTLVFTDATETYYVAEPKHLLDLIRRVEDDDVFPLIRLPSAYGSFESWYPESQLSIIEMPLLKLMEAVRGARQETDEPVGSDQNSQRGARSASPNTKPTYGSRKFVVLGEEIVPLSNKAFQDFYFNNKPALTAYAGQTIEVASAMYTVRNRKPHEITYMETSRHRVKADGSIDDAFEKTSMGLATSSLYGPLSEEKQRDFELHRPKLRPIVEKKIREALLSEKS